jgi:hypothetical protein
MSTNEWWVEGGADLANGKFLRNKLLKENEVNKFRFQHNNIGVFTTIYKYDSCNQKEANLLADFYLDIDNEDINFAKADTAEVIRHLHHGYAIAPEYLKIYFSGRKGFHIIVPHVLLGVQPCSNLNVIYRMMAEDINALTPYKSIDLKIYDKRRLLRLPNSLHPKTNLYKIPISYTEFMNLSADQIIELAKEPRTIATDTPKSIAMANMRFQVYKKRANMKKVETTRSIPINSSGYIPPCIQSLYNSPVKEGSRNSSAAALASFYRQNGLTLDEARSKIEVWNTSRCDPCMSDYEIQVTLRSVYKGEYKMGCTWLNSISNCDKLNCKIFKNRR